MFKEVPAQFDFPAEERRILEFWESNRIYEKSLERRKGSPPFLFYEGPPTANGLPHPGHCLTRAIKDLFPRYKTMCGYYCERKAGWDTHGLPVEVEVCKELGIHSKEEIEQYGVEPFIRKCLESVFRYTREWEQLTKRLGFWVNLDEAYVTYHQSYVESVWWALKTLFDTGLLYQGHKIVWWWAQGGTALSSGEVGQGYREVDDPSVYVRFPLVEDERYARVFPDRAPSASAGPSPRTSLLVWTTTPWTLPSNTFAAVHRDFDYCIVRDSRTGERLIFANALRADLQKKFKAEWEIERIVNGSDLVGLRYVPPFPECYYEQPAGGFKGGVNSGRTLGELEEALVNGCGNDFVAWRVVQADFVTLDSGTGLVHEAPAFGEVDFDLLQEERERFGIGADAIDLLCAVAPDGKFTADAGPKYQGRWVKEADKDIIRDLKERGLLLHQEQYRHDYPFCWRADEDPLIQYPRKSWFIRTTRFKDDMLANNERINWLPDHIKHGRFGKFLESNVDWALSRERYWGTPLPIWVCEKTGQMEAIASYEELLSKPGVQGVDVWQRAKQADPALSEHLKVHKPYIDEITYQSPRDPAARMRRVPDVIDCWFDSGAMPFAQWGFPHAPESVKRFAASFPADFISEALDQTRGWFYSLVAISTLLFGKDGASRGTGLRPVQDGAVAQENRPRGVSSHPVTAELSRTRRTLPHWQQGGGAYFVTFRLKSGELSGEERTIVLDACRHWDGARLDLHAAVVMPDHVHLIVTPLTKSGGEWWSLSDLMHSIKGFTARMINDRRGAEGPVWQEEFYDHIIRNEADYAEKRGYMIANPTRKGLPQDYRWLWIESESGEASAALGTFRTQHGPEARATRVSADWPQPFRNCIVLGLLMGEDGLKMSKSKKNYKEPSYIFEHEGADAMRWLFFSGQAPWTSIRFQESAIAEAQREFLIRLYNVYSFFVIYANIDRWSSPALHTQASAPGRGGGRDGLSELDRWILSELHRTVRDVRAAMDAFDNFSAARQLNAFVDALSNWYVRRSRERFWKSGMDSDKQAAYRVLYDCLVSTTLLIAPFTPFFAESLYRNLVVGAEKAGAAPESVHLCDYPAADDALIDEKLSEEMAIVRDIVSLGRAARAESKIRVRQPLPLVEIVLADRSHTDWLRGHEALFRDELNVKQVEFTAEADHYVNYQVKPNFKAIGPKFGKLAPAIKAALASAGDPAAMRRQIDETGRATLEVSGQTVELTPEDVQIELTAKPGWAAAQGRTAVVVLKTEISDELRQEGLARELVHHVQQIRKEMDLKYEQRIELAVKGNAAITGVAEAFTPYITSETLATRLSVEPIPGAEAHRVNVEGHEVDLFVRPQA